MPQEAKGLHVEIKEGQRALACGTTGSGKTVLMRYMLRGVKRLVVLDPKGTLYKWGLEEWGPATRKRMLDGDPVRMRVPLEAGENSQKFWEGVLRDVYRAAYLVLYIDEAYGVNRGSNAGEWLEAIWTRGREFEITAIAATQRPRNIPLILMTEAEHFFVFELRNQDDRDHVAGYTDPAVKVKVPDPHGFYYYQAGKQIKYYRSLPKQFVQEANRSVEVPMERKEAS